MTISARALGELVAPSRDAHVAALLEEQARALGAGREIETEPILRDAQGRVLRTGPLDLPARADLALIAAGVRSTVQTEPVHAAGFAPVEVIRNPEFTASVAPFSWNRVGLSVSTAAREPVWIPLRHWFLEWFQARQTPLSPELEGAVHALGGPESGRFGWRFVADLGSAPVECVPALIAAVSLSGAVRLRIGADDATN